MFNQMYTKYLGSDWNTDLMLENNANGDPIYVGVAIPGTATSDNKWQISKLTYDGSGFLTEKRFASGNDRSDKIWDNRASYSY